MSMSNAMLSGRAQNGVMQDDDEEVDPSARPKRRTFTAEYKTQILAEYDSTPRGGQERGAILRREGLYSSHITEWRRQAEAGAADGLARKSSKRRTATEIELEKEKAKNKRLETELAKTRLALEITGKAHALLELLSESADTNPKSKP